MSCVAGRGADSNGWRMHDVCLVEPDVLVGFGDQPLQPDGTSGSTEDAEVFALRTKKPPGGSAGG